MSKYYSDYMDNNLPVPHIPNFWKIFFTIGWIVIVLAIVALIIGIAIAFLWLILPLK